MKVGTALFNRTNKRRIELICRRAVGEITPRETEELVELQAKVEGAIKALPQPGMRSEDVKKLEELERRQ